MAAPSPTPASSAGGLAGLVASVAAAVAGLAASAMLLVDYVRPAPVFCAEGGGCDALKHTVFAMPFGVPLPVVGLAGFVALGASALVPGRRARRAQVALAACAGLAGAALLALQALLGHLCPYCCVADGGGVLSLAIAAFRLRTERPGARVGGWGASLGGAASLVAAAAVPLAAGLHVDPTPQVIRAEIAQAPAGVLTVVDFVDFECPFCRMVQAELAPVLESHRGKIHLVRRQVPLTMHAHARDAARAACCAQRLGQGDAMADALFAADVDELTPEGCEKIAASLGLPLDPYRACIASPATDASIDADKAEFKAAGGYALPTLWIGQTPVIGAQPREELAKGVHEALAKLGS